MPVAEEVASSRGEYWLDATCSATTVRPSTRATTEIIVPAVPMSSVRASSGVPWKTSLYSNPSRGTGTNESIEPATSVASTAIPGSTHSDPRTYSPTSSRRRLLPASPNIRSREWPVERIVQSVIHILLQHEVDLVVHHHEHGLRRRACATFRK